MTRVVRAWPMHSRFKAHRFGLAFAASALVPAHAATSAGLLVANAVIGLLVIALAAGLIHTRLRLQRRSQMISELAEAVERLTLRDHVGDTKRPEPGASRDLSDELERLRIALQKASSSHDYLNQVIRTIRDALIVTRTDGTINRVNPAAEALLGRANAELRDLPLISLVAESQRADFSLGDNQGRTRETTLLNAAGEPIPVTYSCAALGGDDPALRGHVVTVHNISERKAAEQRIRYLARIDALTKVPNRMQFQHLLQRALARARRGKHRLALIYMDVDKFKEINDTFGHTAGDLCLETLTTRLRNLLPEGSVIGRMAGDEFGVVLDNLDPGRNLRAEVVATTRLLQEAISEPLNFQGHQIYTTVSAGISLYPGDGNNVIDLIRNADAAMYASKQGGGNTFSFYHPEMNAAAVERLMLKSKLRRAFERDELRVHYQPKVDLRDGRSSAPRRCCAGELPGRGDMSALAVHPAGRREQPDPRIGEWVLNRVCRDYRACAESASIRGRIS
jgi:diguanylate cyclase (GGDEF)-like protein/PAS domain S-box-containing protein